MDTPTSISFYAPDSSAFLHPGDDFYVNLFFTGTPTDSLSFEGSWTQDAVVPEPSTFVLSALGLLGLGVWRRKRSA